MGKVRKGERRAAHGPRTGQGDEMRRQAPPSRAVSAADPYEGANWGDTFGGVDWSPEEEGTKETVPAKPPIKPHTYFVAQLGRTALNFSAPNGRAPPLNVRATCVCSFTGLQTTS